MFGNIQLFLYVFAAFTFDDVSPGRAEDFFLFCPCVAVLWTSTCFGSGRSPMNLRMTHQTDKDA